MSPKRTISRVIHRLGFLTHASTWYAGHLRVGRILMFHGVGNADYPAAEFERHLRYLKQHFDIVSLEELLRRLDSAGDKLANATVLTFDDGLQSHFSVAYPILRRLELPATFFVCPGLIESQRWLWNQEARARLCSTDAPARRQFTSRCQFPSDEDPARTVERMKSLTLNQRQQVEKVLCELTPGFRPSREQRTACDIMSWDQLRALDPALIAVGSHTVGHPILATLAPDQLHSEIAESRRWLEEKLQREVKYFCYPNGAFNSAVLEQTRQVYAAAVTTERSFVTAASDPFRLPRIGSAETLPLLAWRMHRPSA